MQMAPDSMRATTSGSTKLPRGIRSIRPGEAALSAPLGTAAGQLRDAILGVAWRQWSAIGAGAASHGPVHAVVDPEALVLGSLMLVHVEPRLGDLIHDWTTDNADLLSVQRAKNLLRDYDDSLRPSVATALQWLARIAVHNAKDLRWRSVLGSPVPAAASPRRWIPPDVRTNRHRAIRVPFADATTLMLHMRLALGVGVKADLMTCLLSSPERWTSVRDIVERTAYTPAAVRRSVEDLAAARFVQSRDTHPVGYRVSRANWTPLLDLAGDPPQWRDWRRLFAFAIAFLSWHEAMTRTPRPPYVVGVEARDLLERHRGIFEQTRSGTWEYHTRMPDWPRFVADLVSALAHSLRPST